jgi:hypothetical protein
MSPRITLFVAAVAFAGCESCGRPSPAPAPEATAPEPVDRRPESEKIRDADGIRLPQEQLAFGTPVPVGLEQTTSGRGWIRYTGPVRPSEVIDFYRKYLTLPEGTAPHEVGDSTRFRDARPTQPGNPGRPVEVRVIDEQKGRRTGLLILDIVALDKNDGKDWESIPLADPRKWKPKEPGEKVPSELL